MLPCFTLYFMMYQAPYIELQTACWIISPEKLGQQEGSENIEKQIRGC
jgi:hypothetical protein